MAISSYTVPGTCAVQLLATASGFPPSTPACPASHFLSSILRIQAQTHSAPSHPHPRAESHLEGPPMGGSSQSSSGPRVDKLGASKVFGVIRS